MLAWRRKSDGASPTILRILNRDAHLTVVVCPMNYFDLNTETAYKFLSSRLMRRLIYPIFFTILLIITIEHEIKIYLRPGFWDKTSWILHDPYKGETFDRLIVMEKLSRLLKYNPDIISVGDSSGFFSLQPTIINRYIRGKLYVNLSTGANQAFDGYKAIAEFALKRTPSIKYVVLYMYPHLIPSDTLLKVGDLSPLLQENLISFRSRMTPPSATLSPYFKTMLFEGGHYHRGEPMSNHKVTLEFRASIEQTLGWAPEHDIRFDRFFGRGSFYSDERSDWLGKVPGSERSTINFVLGDFEKMVERYGAKLIIAFGPLPQQAVLRNDSNMQNAEKELERFQIEHPNVVFMFPLITEFASEKFGQFNHIAREYTFISSKRIGMALERYFENPQSVPKFTAQAVEQPDGGQPELHAIGDDNADLRDAATAFYLYTATTDAVFRGRISKRVLDLIDHDKAFGFMMDDAKAKIAYMAKSHEKLGYSTGQLMGTPVAVKNVAHCNDGDPTLEWVQLSGVMTFTYDDLGRHSTEPVSWPKTSNILVPTISEDGVRKFDGYCPEPSMADFHQD
jgi:hypothetical protein